MFIRQLQYLCALDQEKHFGHAAEICNVSQPTLSAGIHNLEAELGIPIVRRAQRFEGFTPEGERVLSWAQRILADWDGLKQDVRGICDEPAGELRMGAIPTTLPIVSLLTKPCRANYPAITHSIFSLPSLKILKQIESFDLDIGLTYLENERQEQFLEIPLYRERYVLITKHSGRFETQTTITWSEAGHIPLCLLTSNMQNRRIIDAAFSQAGVTPKIEVETDSIFALFSHVHYGGLACVMPHSFLALFTEHSGISVLRLEPALSRQIGVLMLKRDPPSPLVNAFKSLLPTIDIQEKIDRLIDGIN